MKKAVLLAFVLVSLSVAILGTGLIITVSGSTTHHVYSGESIQEAVNSAQLGDTILVHAGIYYENVIVNKTVSLIGENKHTTIIDGGAAQFDVVYVSAHNVTINSFTLQRGGRGIYPDRRGIYVYSSNNINISNNVIRHNVEGIFICISNDNVVRNNSVQANTRNGLWLYGSSNNVITCNTIADNGEFGMILQGACSNNLIFHNIFINTQNYHIATTGESGNVWDDGYPSGGNYWSDYNGTDANQDGIGDTAYIIDDNNQDNYSLMGMFYDFTVEVELEQTRHVRVISNSTVSNLEVRVWLTSPNEYLQPGDKFIYYVVDGEEGSVGFCRIMIPRVVLNDSYVVLVDWHEVSATELPFSNSTHAYLYFTYNHSTHEVVIVPEFSTWTATLLILIVLTVAIAIYKRRLLNPLDN